MKDQYVELARQAVETFVGRGRPLTLAEAKQRLTLPEAMLEQRAGVFVTIRVGSSLRGCIGTIEPQCSSVAEEILRNAVSSASEDPRFTPIEASELDHLNYSVDILMPAEVCTFEDLDPDRYGIIVSRGYRRGLLLPRLDGIDNAFEQFSIACQKAGLRPDEAITLERFEVIRHA